jgi:DNA primase
MIEKEKIERIKQDVDLVALIRANGVKLKKNGKSWFGLCPFHDDHNPSLSINPSTNLWQCFGCGAGGDVIRFVELFDQVEFKEAVNRLSVNSCQLPVKNKKQNRPNRKKTKQPVSQQNCLNFLIKVSQTFRDTIIRSNDLCKFYILINATMSVRLV